MHLPEKSLVTRDLIRSVIREDIISSSSVKTMSDRAVPVSGSDKSMAGGKHGCDEGPGVCSVILTLVSIILIIVTLPFSLLFVVKVVQVRKLKPRLLHTLWF